MAKLPKEYNKWIGNYENAPQHAKLALRKAGHGPKVVETVVEEVEPYTTSKPKKKTKTTKKSTK